MRGYSIYAAAGAQPYALVVTGSFTGSLTRTGTDGTGDCAIVVAGGRARLLALVALQCSPRVLWREALVMPYGRDGGRLAARYFQWEY